MRKRILISALCFLQINILFAQTTQNVDAIVDSILYGSENGFIKNKSVVGASIGVYWQGNTTYYYYGYSDKENNIKVDNNTRFEIGSNTKVFTGLMLSVEIANGKMDSNDFIDKYVTVNKNIRNKVKITDLANHISGLPTFHDSISLMDLANKDTTKDPLMLVTDDYMLSVLLKTDSLHNYGEYEYSNFAVGILGYILQKQEHSSYDNLLQRMICKPLGMQNTTAIADTNNNMLAKGYSHKERTPFINLCNTMQGAGAITSNIKDMMTFIKYQLNGGTPLQDALTISHKKYYTGENLQIAMGWHINNIYNSEIYEMEGATYGASSLMMYDKEHKLGIVILMNSDNSGVVERSESILLAKLLDGTSDFQKRFDKPKIIIEKKVLDSYAGVYELEKDFDAAVSIENDELNVQLTGQPKLAFKAVEENWFVMEKYNCQLEFIKSGNAICNEFILHQNGQAISCKRK